LILEKSMTVRRVTTKAELLVDIEHAWTTLKTALDRLTETQMTMPQDEQGWTVKHHLIHLTFWERSVVFFLQGQPRHLGLGVAEALYLKGNDDEINAAIYQQHKDLPLSETLDQLRSTHQQLLKALEPLTDADLRKPYRYYLPEEPGEGDGPSALNVIYGNSAHHFAEHLPWIAALVKGTPG
jgi:hypothetical protein